MSAKLVVLKLGILESPRELSKHSEDLIGQVPSPGHHEDFKQSPGGVNARSVGEPDPDCL